MEVAREMVQKHDYPIQRGREVCATMMQGWRRTSKRCRPGPAVLALVMTVTLLRAGAAAAAGSSVGVVDFYAPSPLPLIGSVIPERTAADELSAFLARAGNGVTVVPRATVVQAERTMGWREQDALKFDRLSALARAAGADRLVVGWIRTLNLGGAGNEPRVPSGNGMRLAQAAVVVQVFDAGQGRLVAERSAAGTAIGVVPEVLVRDVLRNAIAPAVPWLVTQLTPASVRVRPGCCG